MDVPYKTINVVKLRTAIHYLEFFFFRIWNIIILEVSLLLAGDTHYTVEIESSGIQNS